MEHMAVDELDPATILMLSEEGDCDRQLQGVLCAEAMAALLDYGITSPNKARTLSARIKHPEATLAQLAQKLGITAPAVHQHLSAARQELRRKS